MSIINSMVSSGLSAISSSQQTINRPAFKINNSFEKRRKEYEKIVSKFPNKIPVIVEKVEKSNVPSLDKYKFLVTKDTTIGQFVYVIRRRINLKSEEAMFVFINNTLPPMSSLMSEIYDIHKDKDGFLYLKYTGENTFG